MSDTATLVDAWLEPLADSPCGADPEYDNDFHVELSKAINGKPGDQFNPEGEAPNWRAARQLCESIFERCRDVRLAIFWARTMVHVENATAVADGMRLVAGLLERYWDTVHPVPDDGDAYARVNALNDMATAAGLLGDLRSALIVANRQIGEVRGRGGMLALELVRPGTLEPDKAAAALVMDLKQRGLLDETIVVWGGEFGRTPMNEGRGGSPFPGRDHHPRAFTMWMAGGGIKPGSVGKTDELGYNIVEDEVSVHDLHATILNQMGIDHTRLTFKSQGRNFRLTDVFGNVVEKLTG